MPIAALRRSSAAFCLFASCLVVSAELPLQNASQRLVPVAQHDRVTTSLASRTKLKGHLPGWATPQNQLARQPVGLSTPVRLSIALTRDPAVQAAFMQLLDDQQNPASPRYHQWLTPQQIGDLFGPTQNDVSALANWLTAQGLVVDAVSPSRMLIEAHGSTATAGNAFGVTFANFAVGTRQLRSITSEPTIPTAFQPLITGILGLSDETAEPQHIAVPAPTQHSTLARPGNLQTISPDYTVSSTTHYTTPADFATIYDITSVTNGGNKGATIGSTAQHVAIIGRSRVADADVTAYGSIFGAYSTHTLNQIVPTGATDPGTPNNADTQEAILDVERVLGTSPAAVADLVVAASGSGGDITAAINYNVNTLMDPVMNISFGACEANAGSAITMSYDTIFSQGAAEGMTILISSGDSGAAGCESHGSAPVAPETVSPNYLCASSYVTCVGGTEFNDTASPSTYWSASNSSAYGSALSYIPEGAWNEPGTAGSYVVVASGGGVSSYIQKPSWQTGTGVPADGYRDTPDIAFTAAGHDGYYICYGGTATSCAGYIFSGTSASAPGMAGIAALLNTARGVAQGNLNPALYSLYTQSPGAFHDVTVASSGVSGCVATTPSMCNNATAGSASSLTGGAVGYLVGTGYDQVTGLGSLDVANFLTATAGIDLVVTSTHSGTINPAGTGYTYSLTVANKGSTASSGTVTVVDTLPSGFTATAISGTGWTCTLGSLTCTRADALAGKSSYPAITLTFSVGSGVAVGTYANSVTVTGGGATGSPADASVDETTVSGPALAATATLSFSPASIAVGGTSSLSITLASPAGNSVTLTSAAVTEMLTTGASVTGYTAYTCTSGSSATVGSYGTPNSSIGGATLLPGGSCTLVVTVTSSTPGSYTSTTNGPTATNGPTGVAATPATLTVIGPASKLAITTAPVSPIKIGGSTGAVSVTVQDSAGNIIAGSTTAVTLTVTGPSYSQVYNVVPTNGVATFPSVTLSTSGTYTYTASESGLTSATATELVLFPPVLTESFNVDPVIVGNPTILTLTLTNPNASTTVTGILYTDYLPSGIGYTYPNFPSSTCGGTQGGNSGTTNGSITLSNVSLPAGSSCQITVKLSATGAGTYTNTTSTVTSTNAGTGAAASVVLTAVTANSTRAIQVISPTVKSGQTALINGFISYPGTVPPTGAVTVLVNGSSAGISGLSCAAKSQHMNCVVTYNATGVAANQYTLTISQAADANYTAAYGTGYVTVY